MNTEKKLEKTQDLPDGFDYVGDVYRPPGEAHNILIQATIGCSHQACTFCSGHFGKQFALKDDSVLERDLSFAECYCKRQDRVFVMDGNALVMPMSRWIWLLKHIRTRLPWVVGVGAFATALDLSQKSDADLKELRSLGLDRLYVGVESGHAAVLERIRKGIDPTQLLAQCARAKEAGFVLNVSVLLGIVDAGLSLQHARATGELLSALNPDAVTVMTLIPQPGTVMRDEIDQGELVPPDTFGILAELRELYLHTKLRGGLFDYSHSSGYFPFTARLPEERQTGLESIDLALSGQRALKRRRRI